MSLLRTGLSSLLIGLLSVGAVACSADSNKDDDNSEGNAEDLTSITARSRTLEFVGTVYVETNANADTILQAVRGQAQTAFGPLRTSDMAVNSRELREIDTSTFKKRTVKVVDGSSTKNMLEVTYNYKDNAVVAASYATRTTAPLVLMNPNYRSQLERVLTECTTNDDEAREFSSTVWYVFEPKLSQCQTAIQAEQQKVTTDRNALTDPQNSVAKSEVDRLYLPITVKLGADKTNKGNSYPEYNRLFKGGVKEDKLVISLVYGLLDHTATGGPETDYNWGELMDTLSETMDAGGDYKVVDGPDNPNVSHFTLASGKVVSNPSIKDLVGLKSGGGTALNLSSADAADLQKQFAAAINGKWLAIEKTIKVAIGNESPHDFGVQFLVFFGAQFDSAPHKYATKNSDVFLYNGHSSIGYGPLDPKNFTAEDFPKSYQILWIDGCVSYNYYEKDYIPLKEGGTKNLDLITNGIEAPSWHSGHAMGQWLIKLLDGSSASYRDLLEAATDTDPLRVVDGELDNTYKPTTASMKVVISSP